jgi:chitinase
VLLIPAAPRTLSGRGIDAFTSAPRLRRCGRADNRGDVVPSFGGAAADTSNTEIADSCDDVDAIAAEYERVISTYGVSRLDFDIEEDSINSPANRAGIDRRNKAINLVERWAKRTHRTVQFVYTIPTEVSGLDAGGVHLLRNAVENHARVDVVNIMTGSSATFSSR